MGRTQCKFRETEVRRAIRAAEATGKKVSKFEIDGGKIVIIFGGDNEQAPQTDDVVL